jgi:hypothetical protein
MLSYTPLYRKLETDTKLPLLPFDKESYKKPNLLIDLDQQREVLEKIRSEHKPMRLTEIKKFAKKMEKAKQKMLKEMRDHSQKHMQQLKESFDPVKYFTKFQKEYVEREKLRRLEAESHERKKLDLVNKRKKFSQIVLETHKPKISLKKKKEVELRMMLQHNTGN